MFIVVRYVETYILFVSICLLCVTVNEDGFVWTVYITIPCSEDEFVVAVLKLALGKCRCTISTSLSQL